ncbi:hypothetical protein GCM10023149_28630 [Mucilaginibacter gynuensis]|uniref:Uncharacterized protein n=2 Tax=Mucilaginibacter gynuensis TaxID=1302236 RepID=A0ABP8GKK4_9SPHI
MVYAENSVNCKVVMENEFYDVYFDGRWMAAIAHTDEWTWIQASGVPLPENIIEEIGARIESEYK